MIQPYYCEEKLDAGHPQGLKSEYLKSESKRFYSRTQHNAPARSRTQTFLHLESSILTTEPPRRPIGYNEH